MNNKEIPIQNIYYMLMYAWNKSHEINNIETSKVKGSNIYELLILVLNKSIARIIKKGIYKEYKNYYEETSSLRGKINFDDSLKRNSFRNGRAFCKFDEFTSDIIHNQILKATLHNILKYKDIPKEIRNKTVNIYHYFEDIQLIKISKSSFCNVSIHKNNQNYKLSLDICKFLYDNMIPNESCGKITFKEFYRDDKVMAYIFENFVRNFYNRHLEYSIVKREDIRWDEANGLNDLLPIMKTDITIKTNDKVIIMDTKYYKKTLIENMNIEKIHSNNLYQIFSYLKNAEVKGKEYKNSTGILLYPKVNKFLDKSYDIQGHNIRVCTVNLNDDWQNIHRRLIDIFDSTNK